MNKFLALIVPALFLISFVFALFKKVRLYDSFTEGVKGAIPLVVSIFPYIASVAMLTKLLEVSGLEKQLSFLLSDWTEHSKTKLGVIFDIFGLLSDLSFQES